MRLVYLVHDLHDAAVARRVALFARFAAMPLVAGFRRRAAPPATIGGAPVIDFGRTEDGRLIARAGSVLRHLVLPARLRAATRDADVLVARNLEMLVLARRVRRRGQRLVYECLDIHRLLLGEGRAARALARIERWALSGVDLVVVSAPRFRDAYFVGRRGHAGPVLLVENKVPAFGEAPPAVIAPPPPPPWVIGWFGMLRCSESLHILAAIAAQAEGRIEVLIAGRPSPSTFDDFEAAVAAAPGVRYVGAYAPADLPALFGRIHFIWAIDYFEEGLNSAWLLPNRLYEGIANGAVPLALRGVATGDWLAAAGAGVLLDDPAAELPPLLAGLDEAAYARLRDAVAGVPAAAVAMADAEGAAVAARIMTGAGR